MLILILSVTDLKKEKRYDHYKENGTRVTLYPNETWFKVECGSLFDNSLCHLHANSRARMLMLMFVRDGSEFMRLNINLDMIREVKFEHIMTFIRDNYKNSVTSFINSEVTHCRYPEGLFESFACANVPTETGIQPLNLTPEQTLLVCYHHIDILPVHFSVKERWKQVVKKSSEDYL